MKTKFTEKQIRKAINYWKTRLRRMDEAQIVEKPARRMSGVRPFAKKELDDVILKMGQTDDFQEAGWIFPDGRMPNMHRTEETYFDDDYTQFYMDGRIVDNPQRYEHDYLELSEKREAEMDAAVDASNYMWRDYFLAAGFVRIDGAESATVEIAVRPTRAQLDRLYDFVDLPWEKMRDFYRHRQGITQFAADICGTHIVYDDVDEFRRRLMNDVKNFSA